jgi:hypothetical protein
MLSYHRLAKSLASTLVKQSSGGLTDQQVDAFLALYDHQVRTFEIRRSVNTSSWKAAFAKQQLPCTYHECCKASTAAISHRATIVGQVSSVWGGNTPGWPTLQSTTHQWHCTTVYNHCCMDHMPARGSRRHREHAVLPLLLLLLCVQVPDSIKSDPRELQQLLDASKHIARDLDGE